MNEENKVVSLDEARGERQVAEMNTEMAEQIEWETNQLMRSIYETLTKIKNPRQAISAGMAMITTGKDLMILEMGVDGAKAYINDIKYDTIEIVQRQRNEELRNRPDIPENDGGDKNWQEAEVTDTDSEGGEI